MGRMAKLSCARERTQTEIQPASITTFAQFAADASSLDKILADASTRAEQAKLAADGKMDELKKLQDSLKGGRRV